MTAGAHRHRISAIRRNPKVSVVVTSTGTEMGPGKTVTVKGKATIPASSPYRFNNFPETKKRKNKLTTLSLFAFVMP